MTRVILHVGMHKTGSSSVQAHLSNTPYAEFHYPVMGGHRNHNTLIALLCHEPVERFHLFRGQASRRELIERRATERQRFEELIRNDRYATVLFSAEYLSRPDDKGRSSFFEWVRALASEVELFAYVRGPRGFMESIFQQSLKGAKTPLEPRALWPRYRARFQCIEEIFGRPRVTYAPFDRATLKSGDVVEDLLARIGARKQRAPAPERFNRSWSLEAVALLFTWRSCANTEQSRATLPPAMRTLLRGFGDGVMRFSDRLTRAVWEDNREDLAWMEDRVGRLKDPRRLEGGLESAADLIAVADQNRDAFARYLSEQGLRSAPRGASPAELVTFARQNLS